MIFWVEFHYIFVPIGAVDNITLVNDNAGHLRIHASPHLKS